ncbi:hypothetical protein [Novosphingobium lindaniclasticum]|uniref:hypothetical protein n=1 Tax=Novosphingobium lindaniclasticum TaxID=1329895 RepID=UPI0024091D28|nr:hypothetical protein [Novosphingobium lindaniclasticum]
MLTAKTRARPRTRVERIESHGHTTPPEQLYVQGWDERVLLPARRRNWNCTVSVGGGSAPAKAC